MSAELPQPGENLPPPEPGRAETEPVLHPATTLPPSPLHTPREALAASGILVEWALRIGRRRLAVRSLVSVVLATAASHAGLLWFSVPRANAPESLNLTVQYLGRYTSFMTLVFGLLGVPVLLSGLLDQGSRTLLRVLCRHRGVGEASAGRAETAATVLLLGIAGTIGAGLVLGAGLVRTGGGAFSAGLLTAFLAQTLVCWSAAILLVLWLVVLRRANGAGPWRIWLGMLFLPELLALFEPSLCTYRTIAFDLGRWIVRMGAGS